MLKFLKTRDILLKRLPTKEIWVLFLFGSISHVCGVWPRDRRSDAFFTNNSVNVDNDIVVDFDFVPSAIASRAKTVQKDLLIWIIERTASCLRAGR
jgi:hypothetical protein